MSVGRWGWALGLSVALLGCGARFQSAACREIYDGCTSDCADECGDGEAPAEGWAPETVNTWSMACSACEERCRGQARGCDDRADREVTP